MTHSILTDVDPLIYPPMGSRRAKAAAMAIAVWSVTIALHLVSWGLWVTLFLTVLFGSHTLRLLLAKAKTTPQPLAEDIPIEEHPYVSLVVSAKNEESVIEVLVRSLDRIDYPKSRFELWVVDDNSSDRTYDILQALKPDYPQLKVYRRSESALGGKSGALNDVLPLTQGDILGVFDADAIIAPGLLRAVVPFFEQASMGAVQVRKCITNAETNFLTQGQQAEMTLDAFIQQQRVATGGLGELRGNGQFVRKQALEHCGGWNELTITDDLDLTFRLQLNGWDIDVLSAPAVQEEGVTSAMALWHQRNRWAEGGYQRYLDYWPLLAGNRLGLNKSYDMVMFYVTQYALPTAAVPDFLMAIAKHRFPLFMPMTSFTLLLSFVGTWVGLVQVSRRENRTASPFSLLSQAIRSTVYMFHWLPVVASVTARMSIRPKRLKWVKTQRVSG